MIGSLIAKEGGEAIEPVDAGVHQAICYAIYDLGTQYSPVYDKSSRKCVIIWELPDRRIEIVKDGQTLNLPRAISKQYTLSLGEKANLRKDLETWRGKAFSQEELAGFDISKLVGVNCMLQVLHKVNGDKTYANIVSILPLYKNLAETAEAFRNVLEDLRKGINKLEPENPLIVYTLDQGTPPETTPKWITKIISESAEMKASDGVVAATPEQFPDSLADNPDDSEVPF